MPRITETFCRQHRHEALAEIPRYGDGPRQIRFTHILNPYRAASFQDKAVQELTFETIRAAAREAAPSIAVRCVCVTAAGDRDIVPDDFIAAHCLNRTVLDVATFAVRRALPLIFDILDNGVAVPEESRDAPGCEDFIIFTNMDIHLQPHFYLAVAEFIRDGYDTIDVHRRTIPQYAPQVQLLPVMYAEGGIHHGGLDCIIFPRKKYPSFVRNNACVGMSLVMKGVLVNCALQARRFLVLSNSRLTFHLGNDRAWAAPLFDDYTQYNLSQFQNVIREMSKDQAAAARLITALRTMQLPPQLVALAEKTAGMPSTAPGGYAAIRRKLKGARLRLIRKALELLKLPDEAASQDHN
jgi:hypothetical protein